MTHKRKQGGDFLEMLSVADFAKLSGVTRQATLQRIKNNKIYAVSEKGRGGSSGKIYKIPVSELTDRAKIKHNKNNKPGLTEKNAATSQSLVAKNDGAEYGGGSSFALMCRDELTFENCNKEQREKALWLKEMLFVWQHYRSEYKNNYAEADNIFLNRIKQEFNKDLNIYQLYRYQKAYRDFGEIGLVDFRGVKNKGKTDIDKDLWALFEYLYLDENQKTAAFCYEQVKIWAFKYRPNVKIQSYSAFNRTIKQIPYPIIEYFRYGQKSFIDNCEKYLTRMVEDLQPNDIWVADNHTIDVISKKDGSDARHRMYLTAFIDARSRLIVGFNITDTPNSDSTVLALRDGILRHGKPKMIYVDNGREFLTNDIGGRGHRKGKKKLDITVPPTILQLLEIKMINALPRNAKAKVIERWFGEFTRHFSVLFNTYISNNPVNRPEYTKYSVKSNNIVKDSELISFAERFINGYINCKPQFGRGMNGKSPLEVWNENITEKIIVSKDKLNLLLMRVAQPQLVSQNGVYLNIYNEKIWYFEEKFVYEHIKKTRVFLRYDPKNLSKVRVYDMDDRFIAELPLDENAVGSYISDKDDISALMKEKRHLKKLVKSEYENRIYQGEDRLNSYQIINLAIDSDFYKQEYQNNAILTKFQHEEKQYEKAVVGIDEEFDMLKTMAENIKKNCED